MNCENINILKTEIEFPSNNILLERAREIFSEKIKKGLCYKNKKSNNKGISIIKENPLVIQITQNKKRRKISIKDFCTLLQAKEFIRKKLEKNNKFYKENIKNKELLKILNIFDKGEWSKIYIKNHTNNIEIHYFQSENGLIYDLKIKSGESLF